MNIICQVFSDIRLQHRYLVLSVFLSRIYARHNGVNDNVTSPTFSIVNEYLSEKLGSIFHFDFYRIKNEKEAYDIGIDEYLSSDNYCFIEWPNKINSFIDDKFINVYIDIYDSL